MIDFERFWRAGDSPYEDGDESFDTQEYEAPPGVTEERILRWEQTHGVTLPEPIRWALKIRDGGYVRNASIEVLPLDQIVPVEDEFWRFTEIDEDEAPDHSLMFEFGSEIESGATFLMNFNARGPHREPSVYMDHHGESTYLVNDTLSGLFESQLASDDAPSVDWPETEGAGAVIARETIDLSSLYGGRPATEEQVLLREEGALVLFTRERSPSGQKLTRTRLPLPLDEHWGGIQPHRPAPIGTFALHLQPAESDGIVQQESATDEDGRWKNRTGHGVPIYVTFESTDRDRLKALRAELFGAEGADRAQAREDSQDELQSLLGAMPPEQRSAALLQNALKMKEEADRRFAEHYGDLGPMPPELADAAEAIRRRMEELTARIQQRAAANPPDPEMLRRIEKLMRDQLPE